MSLAERHVERREGHAEEPGGLLVREQMRCALAGQPCVGGGALGVADRQRLEEMVRELGEVRLRVIGVELLERRCDPAVQREAATRAQLVVQGVANQGVREAQAPGSARHVDDDARRGRLVEQLEDVPAGAFAHPLERIDPELATEDRRHDQELVAILREVAETPADRLPHPLGNGGPPRCKVAAGRQPALLREQPDDLVEEQRVAVGLRVDRRDERLARFDPRRQTDEVRDLAAGQARRAGARA